MAHFKQFGNGFLIEALLEALLIKALLSDKVAWPWNRDIRLEEMGTNDIKMG